MEVLGGRAQAGGSPPTRVVGATFSLRVPLPSKFGGKYDPASRPSSTPTQLKTGDRRRLTKPGGSKPTPEPKPSKGTNSLPVRRPKKSQSTPAGGTTTFLDRQEYEQLWRQRPERKEAHSKSAQEGRQRARELGLCRDCNAKAIPGQIRCEACAEKPRQSHERRNAAKKEKAGQELNNRE